MKGHERIALTIGVVNSLAVPLRFKEFDSSFTIRSALRRFSSYTGIEWDNDTSYWCVNGMPVREMDFDKSFRDLGLDSGNVFLNGLTAYPG